MHSRLQRWAGTDAAWRWSRTIVLGSLHVFSRAVGGHGSRFCCRTTVGDVARQLYVDYGGTQLCPLICNCTVLCCSLLPVVITTLCLHMKEVCCKNCCSCCQILTVDGLSYLLPSDHVVCVFKQGVYFAIAAISAFVVASDGRGKCEYML